MFIEEVEKQRNKKNSNSGICKTVCIIMLVICCYTESVYDKVHLNYSSSFEESASFFKGLSPIST